MQESNSEEDEERDQLLEDQANARGETPTQKHPEEVPQSNSVGTQPEGPDPNRPPQIYYPSHPMLYSYGPPRPGGPLPWPYMPNGVPMPMPVPVPMPLFAPSPPSTQVPGQEETPAPIPPNFAPYDYQQAQAFTNTWMEYYAQLDPSYARQLEEGTPYQYPLYPSDGAEVDKRRRGRTRTKVRIPRDVWHLLIRCRMRDRIQQGLLLSLWHRQHDLPLLQQKSSNPPTEGICSLMKISNISNGISIIVGNRVFY